MKKLILLLIILNICSTLLAQHVIFDFDLEIPGYDSGARNLLKLTESLKYDNVQGSPYLRKEFLNGQIQINDTARYNNLLLRYNIYDDQIEFKTKNDQIMALINPGQYQFIRIGDQTFVCLTYRISKREQTGILEILAAGKAMLYKKYEVDFTAESEAKPFKDPEPDRFIEKNPAYLISIDDEPPAIMKNNRSVLNALERVKPNIAAYIQEQKINLKKEEDLVKIIQYCNQ